MTPSLSEALGVLGSALFTRDEAAGMASGNGEADLTALIDAGRVAQVADDLYWYGLETPLGLSSARVWDVMKRLYGERGGVGASGVNAVNLLHLTTQVSAWDTWAVPVLHEVHLNRVRLVDRSDRAARAAAGLSYVEITVLEALAVPEWWEQREDEGIKTIGRTIARAVGDGGNDVWDGARVRVGAANEPLEVRRLLERVLSQM